MYCSRVRARMRRHSSGPSISGMYQSEITMGMRASWSRSQASRPFCAPLTSYPPACAIALSWALDTGSSSTTRTEIALGILATFCCAPKIVDRGLCCLPYILESLPRTRHIARPARRFHLFEQRRQGPRADRGRGRLERVGGTLNRLRCGGSSRGLQCVETLRQSRDEGRQDAVDGLLRAGFLHAAAEAFHVDGGRRCRDRFRPSGGAGPALNDREQVVRLERLREVAAHPALQAP